MHGPLHEISLIEVLQLLERGRRSGVLRVVGPDPDTPRTVHLHRGHVAAVEPDAGDAALDRAILRRHLAAADDPATALPVGEREMLRERLARTALEAMMRWPRGRFDFTEAATHPGPLGWSADALVLALVDDESRRVELGESLHGWHAIVAFPAPDALGRGGSFPFEGIDWRILDLVDGTRHVAAIAAALDEPLEIVGARIRALAAATILHVHPPAADDTMEAQVSLKSGQYEDAVTHLRSRVALAPHDAEAWRTLGLAEVGAGRFAEAIAAWEAWQRAAPERQAEATALINAAGTMMEALHDHRE